MSERLEVVDTVDRYRLAKVSEKWSPLLKRFAETPCETPAQKDWWAKYAAKAQKELKALEAERKELTQPLLDSQRKLKAEFDRTAEPVEAFKRLATAKMSAFDLAVVETERKALAAAREAAEAGDSDTALALAQSAPERTKTDGTATTVTWAAEVVDIDAVPAAFVKKELDAKAVKAYVKTLKDSDTEPSIPGVKFVRSVSTRVSGR